MAYWEATERTLAMFKKAINLINQPYPYYIPFSRSGKLLIILSLLVPGFLLLFKPFNIGQWVCPYKTALLAGLAIPVYLTLAFNFYFVSRFLPKFFSEESWTIWKEGVWSAWNFITIVISTGFYWQWVPVCTTTDLQWGQQFFAVFLISIVPGSFCIYFNYSRALKRKLAKAHELNEQLRSKVAFYENGILELTDENESEKLKVSTEHLLLIQAYDNYSKVIWEQGGMLKSKLLRSSLKNIEKQIPYSFITRCYRSFIVNLSRVTEVKGNAREYRLVIDGYHEPIPVSRESYKEILRLFDEFSPVSNDSTAIAYKAV